MVKQGVPLHFWLLLREFQGSFSQLFVEESMEGPAILGGMLDIIMDPAKQKVLPFFFSWWPGHSKWPNNSISDPFVQEMV